MRTVHPLVFIFLVALSAFLFYVGVLALRDNDEARIRRSINAAILGVETHRASMYEDLLSDDYSDEEGLTKSALLARYADFTKDYRPFRVDVKKMLIEVDKDGAAATMVFTCYFHSTQDQKVYYEAGKAVLNLKKTAPKTWKVHKLQYISSDDLMFLPAVA